ncbi:MAG: glutathione S-transferase family protein [Hyphomonas sp.]|nr:glutathione S-transferase family protein [Hyphomonas sp.]
MADLTFYTNPMSRGRIARWMLEESGADYDTVFLRYGPEMQGADYKAINPMMKVPAIVHKGKAVTECAAICAYLAEAFPDAGLAPRPEERADYYRWMFFAAGPWEQASTNKSMGFEIPADKGMMAGYGDFDRTLNVLTGAVTAHPYVCGDRFTAADVYVGSHIAWGMQFGSIPPSPTLQDYVGRLMARPASARGNEKDDAATAEYGPQMPAADG